VRLSAARVSDARLSDVWHGSVARRVVVRLVAVAVLAIVAWTAPWLAAAVITLPLALFLPGDAVTDALFAGDVPLDGALRVASSVAASVVTYPLVALAAYSVGLRLTAASVRVGVVMVVVVASAVLVLRTRSDRDVPPDDPPDPPEQPGQEPGREPGREPGKLRRGTVEAIVLPVITLILAAIILPIALHALPRRPDEPFVSMGLAGEWALVKGPVPVDGPVRIELVVHNATTEPGHWIVKASPASEPDFAPVPVDVGPGAEVTIVVEGDVLAAPCLRRLSIALVGVDSSLVPDPLLLSLGATDAPMCT